MEKDYGNCKHEWESDYLAPTVPRVRCEKCQLCVEIFPDHVSVWDYNLKGDDNPWLGHLFYNKVKA